MKFLRAIGLAAVIASIAVSLPFLRQHVEVITLDPGGALGAYIEKYATWRKNKVYVVIDGMCISACTLITGLIPAERVCVTPFARLAFHSAWMQTMYGATHHSEGTRLAWHVYPPKLREMLKARGWDGDDKTKNEHPDLIYIEGDDLYQIFQPCGVA